MFFDLHARGALDGRGVMLSDNNADLIACYRAVRDCPEQVIGELSRLASGHARDGARHYYEVRNQRFNPQRAALAAAPDREFEYTPSLAAMFVYLNRTGYNGLFRLNSDGEFNVPAGSYAKPKICDEPNLRRVAKALARLGLTLERARFERMRRARRRRGFSVFRSAVRAVEQNRRALRATPLKGSTRTTRSACGISSSSLARRGCHVLMSNSTAPEIAALYEDNEDAASAGLRCYRIPARRAINSNRLRRGTVDEYVITNVRGR